MISYSQCKFCEIAITLCESSSKKILICHKKHTLIVIIAIESMMISHVWRRGGAGPSSQYMISPISPELPRETFRTSRNFKMWYIEEPRKILFPTDENSTQPRVFFAWKIPSWAVNAPRGSRHKISMETFEKLPPASSSTLLPPPPRRHPKSVS